MITLTQIADFLRPRICWHGSDGFAVEMPEVNIVRVTYDGYSVDYDRSAMEIWCTCDVNIQDVFPDLSPDERELLITGLTPATFPPEPADA